MPSRTQFQMASTTITAAAAGNYAAGDVISNSATADAGVAAEIAIGAHQGIIQSVLLKCSDDATLFRPRLHLFRSEPLAAEVEMDDNVAFDIKTSDGADKYIGYIDLPALRDVGTIPSQTQVQGVNMPVHLDGHSVFIVLETLDAETNESASMVITIELYII